MELGWLDICLRTEDIVKSKAFWQDLGFRQVEGKDEEDWAVMVNGEARIGLYGPEHMDAAYTLNFRGGDVPANVKALQAMGHRFDENFPIVLKEDKVGSALLKDPDGHPVFLDTAPGETKPL